MNFLVSLLARLRTPPRIQTDHLPAHLLRDLGLRADEIDVLPRYIRHRNLLLCRTIALLHRSGF